MARDFDGMEVLDSNGERLGTVERSYLDDSGTVQVVSIALTIHRLVPTDDGQVKDGALRLPFSKATVENSHALPIQQESLQGDTLERLRAYYAGDERRMTVVPPDEVDGVPVGQPLPVDAASLPQMGVRDLGDVVEIPIVEERLVKQPVVTEVLRIRKKTVTDERTIEADLRKEEVEVASEGDITLRDEAGDR